MVRLFSGLLHRLSGRGSFGVFVLLFIGLALGQAVAQEQFFTQSGGRGLQNAKTNARLGKIEGDVDEVKKQFARIKPHAFAELGSCSEDGEKLRWDGTNWVCEMETDPTVMPFAKKPLPVCGGGTVLTASGGDFSCQNLGFVTSEVDPTVQAFAKQPLPSCGIGETLAVGGDKLLTCSKDDSGLATESDPNVFDFAKNNSGFSLPNCSATETLTMVGGRLACKIDSTGVSVETDPKVQSFARTDITGATLAACGSGEIVKAVSAGGNVILQCVTAAAGMAEALALNDLSDVSVTSPVSNSVLMFDGTGWVAANERDPLISTVAACGAGQVLGWDGSAVTCVNDAGGSASPLSLAGLNDVNVTGVADGNLLSYDQASSRWVDLMLPTCGVGEVLKSDGVNFSCISDAGGSASPINLLELGDVRTNAVTPLDPDDLDILRWNEASSKWLNVHLGSLALQEANNVSITGGVLNNVVIGGSTAAAATFTTVNATNLLASGLVRGASLLVSNALVQGTLTVTGNLNVSGSQTIDGVTFANGGIQLTGGMSGDRIDVANISATANVSVTGNVSAARFIGDGSQLTGLSGAGIAAAGVVGSVQYKGASGEISGSNIFKVDTAVNKLSVSGTVQVSGNGAEACGAGEYGKMRYVDTGGGNYRMQICRP